MNRLLFAASVGLTSLALAACQSESGASGTPVTQQSIGKEWVMSGFNGGAALPRVTLDLTKPGNAAGQAPCNRWFSSTSGTLPEISFDQAGATRMFCEEMAAEGQFFDALAKVTAVSFEGDKLVLTGEDGVKLEFLPKAS